MLTLYMQQVLGYSPIKTGLGYLAVAVSAILWSGVAAQLTTRIGAKPVLVTGMNALTGGLVYFTQVTVHGSYLADLLPGFLLVGVGLGFSFVLISIAALAGVGPTEGGLASGLSTRPSKSAARSGSQRSQRSPRPGRATRSPPTAHCPLPWCADSPEHFSSAPASRSSACSPRSRSFDATSSRPLRQTSCSTPRST
jgi:hypothetical protein